MNDEQSLIDKLQQVEAMFAGGPGASPGAADAMARIIEQLRNAEKADPPKEYRFSMTDRWSGMLFMALLRRYGIKPYRYRGQRHTTVMAQVARRFVDDTLWPEFLELSRILDRFLDEVTRRVIARAVCADNSEMEVRPDPPRLPAPGEGPDAGPGPVA
jgi:hypothetical protein